MVRSLCVAIGVALMLGGPLSAMEGVMLIDDFSRPGRSALGTPWQGLTDRVMGGVSTMRAGYERQDERTVLRMTGEVSLENNGGFVQVRLPLAARGTLDASEFTGVALEVRGAAGRYFVHLRTDDTRYPWQYYAAPVDVGAEWERITLPFGDFAAKSLRSPLDPARLVSLGVVGGERAFDADISIRRVEFYR